ncbi:serine hydrolase domain-containing protein [Lacticaseibacillus porcinae]|uniref:serine hydrolase domain-containing protein n=1 Tax=Lacticaseibacillus porcinae TaxID=1123687 RepID=UPI000F79FD3A|nr:serine hydrolase domain-containing protein [Lacticaseibacillus porcinae]
MRSNRRRVRQTLWPQVIAAMLMLGVVAAVGFAVGKRAQPQVVKSHAVVHIKTKPATEATLDLQKYLPKNQFSGVAALYRNGKRVATLAQGQATAQTLNTPDNLFEIDSVQKSVTAGLVMHEAMQGKLHLRDHLSQYFPQVPGSDTITIRQLLDMASGLTVQGGFLSKDYINDQTTVDRMLAKLRYTPAMNGQGRYQAADYVVLVGILMKLTHQSYQTLVENEYIKPLHLTHTRFAYDRNMAEVALGHSLGKHGLTDETPVNATSAQQHQELGTGQLLMSVDDLFAVESGLLSGRLLGGNNVSALLFAPGSLSTYGGGLYQNGPFRSANGFGYGYECFLRITQSGRDAVIVMSNCSVPKAANEVAADKIALAWLTH